MNIPVTISQFAHQPKLLPLNKIIESKVFTKVQLSKEDIITENNETISPSNVGTMVDYLTRAILLVDDHAFDIANIKLKEDLDLGRISSDDFVRVMDKEKQLNRIVKNCSEIDKLPEETFQFARDICAWEEAYRSGLYVKPDTYPDEVTIAHIKKMLKIVENFFNTFGWPIRDAFGATTKNHYLKGDGDYLLKNILVDLKASKARSMQIYWVRQLLVYYTLGFYNHFNDDEINRLMIFNALTNTVYYVDLSDIDKSVFDFVNDAAEKQSKINERALKQLGIEIE